MAETYSDKLQIELTDPHGIAKKLSTWDETGKRFKEALGETLLGTPDDRSKWTQAGEKLGVALKKVGSFLLKQLESILSSSLDELDNVLQYSLLTDSNVRDLKFSYGFSDAQAYGFQKSLDVLGISEEDLMYMNPKQAQLFRDAFTKYTNKYNELADSGFFEKLITYQTEMNELKEDLELEFIQFFVDNKDLIKTVLEATLKTAEKAVKVGGRILNAFGESHIGQADVSSVLSNYSTKITTNNISNTFNGVQQKDRTWLANAGQLTYEQLIARYDND